MSGEKAVISLDGLDLRAERVDTFKDKVIFYIESDHDKREVAIRIPKDSPREKPDLFTAEEKEEMIVESIRGLRLAGSLNNSSKNV